LICTGAGWKDLGRFAGDAERLVRMVGVGDVAQHIDRWAALQ
jgi:hypothetical protein